MLCVLVTSLNVSSRFSLKTLGSALFFTVRTKLVLLAALFPVRSAEYSGSGWGWEQRGPGEVLRRCCCLMAEQI